METAKPVLVLYREKYGDLKLSHFHWKLREGEGIGSGYSEVRQALQGGRIVDEATAPRAAPAQYDTIRAHADLGHEPLKSLAVVG